MISFFVQASVFIAGFGTVQGDAAVNGCGKPEENGGKYFVCRNIHFGGGRKYGEKAETAEKPAAGGDRGESGNSRETAGSGRKFRAMPQYGASVRCPP